MEGVDIMGLMQAYDSPVGGRVGEAVEIVGAKITDQPQFMKDATELLGLNDGPADAEFKDVALELTGLEITEECASGRLQDPNSPEFIPICFTRENGSWLISSKPKERDDE